MEEDELLKPWKIIIDGTQGIINNNKDEMIWKGELKNSLPSSGFGTFQVYENDSVKIYEGQIIDQNFEGKGKITIFDFDKNVAKKVLETNLKYISKLKRSKGTLKNNFNSFNYFILFLFYFYLINFYF